MTMPSGIAAFFNSRSFIAWTLLLGANLYLTRLGKLTGEQYAEMMTWVTLGIFANKAISYFSNRGKDDA